MKVLTQIILFASAMIFSNQIIGQTSSTSPIQNVSAVEAQKILQDKDIVILDIRTPREYDASHIKGAININFYDRSFADNLKKLDRNKKYFVYCRSGNRTGQSMRLFSSLGFKDVVHLYRGIIDWNANGYPMTN
jgi:phage shock protein E